MTQLDRTLLTSETYYVAEAGGALAGCGGWSWGQPGTGELIAGQAHIRQFGVHPDWFGRGIGRALYERCEAEARAAGVGRFECFASLNAVGFYDSLGFRQVRPVELTMGETKIRSVIMAREI
jgi:N-acetylglutamate synthase-like GNAT family acetyltransferase